MFYLTAGHMGDRVPGSFIHSEGQSSQSGIAYNSVNSQQLQSQVSCSQMQNDQTQQQQQLLAVSVASIFRRRWLLSLLFHSVNVITSCDVQIKPPTQGVQSEAVPVAPNSQSAPAVSPQVCCSPCFGLKSMVAATVHNRNTLILHFHNKSFL